MVSGFGLVLVGVGVGVGVVVGAGVICGDCALTVEAIVEARDWETVVFRR